MVPMNKFNTDLKNTLYKNGNKIALEGSKFTSHFTQ